MDGFGREEEDMVVVRGCEEGYTEEEDRPEGLLCAATLCEASRVRKKKRVKIREGADLKEGEECLCVDQTTRVGCTRRSVVVVRCVKRMGGK